MRTGAVNPAPDLHTTDREKEEEDLDGAHLSPLLNSFPESSLLMYHPLLPLLRVIHSRNNLRLICSRLIWSHVLKWMRM